MTVVNNLCMDVHGHHSVIHAVGLIYELQH